MDNVTNAKFGQAVRSPPASGSIQIANGLAESINTSIHYEWRRKNMTKNRLLGGIKACKGEIERAEKWAHRYYASFKNGGDWKDYQQSQHYYERCEKHRAQLEVYEEMLNNGDYE